MKDDVGLMSHLQIDVMLTDQCCAKMQEEILKMLKHIESIK